MTRRGSAPGNTRHALAARGDDLYETPAVAVRALLDVERLPHHIWECACGPGSIVQVLRDAGHRVSATDLVDYGCPDSLSGVDFLMESKVPAGVQCVCTNPPFKLAGEFVAHALNLCPIVIVLLRLAFLESARRAPILDGGHLARIYAFSNRLPMMHRHGWTGPTATSQTAFAWFVFDRNYDGPTTLRRISWKPER
jgi:hypothetical protein